MRPVLVITNTTIHKNIVMPSANDIALHWKVQIAGNRIHGTWLQPIKMRFPILRCRFGEKPKRFKVRRIHFQDPGDRQVP